MHLKRVNIPQLLHIFTQLSLSAFWVLKITKNVSMAWWMKGTVYKRGETSNAAICMNRTNMRAMWYRCRACLNRKLAPFLSSRVFFRFSRGTLLRLGIRFFSRHLGDMNKSNPIRSLTIRKGFRWHYDENWWYELTSKSRAPLKCVSNLTWSNYY